MNKDHRRSIRRLAKKFNLSIDESISKFYLDQKVDKNVVFSILKKRNKGGLKKAKRNKLRKEEMIKLQKQKK